MQVLISLGFIAVAYGLWHLFLRGRDDIWEFQRLRSQDVEQDSLPIDPTADRVRCPACGTNDALTDDFKCKSCGLNLGENPE